METDIFQRPASYWLRRAERSKQNGDLIRAAVLERHAVRAEGGSMAARASYVLTLRQLHCYEASNREAFAALAQDPDQKELYGLIGMNLLAMGLKQEGVDALNTYLNEPITDGLPYWHDDAYDLACFYDKPPQRKRRARLDGLLHIAAGRLNRGDRSGAQRALTRASRAPFHAPSARRELLTALYLHMDGKVVQAARHVRNALALKPWHSQHAASAASLLGALGLRRQAVTALWQAAIHARTPADELSVCMASEQLGCLQAALAMLQRSLRHQADRYPVCYDLCVCLMKLGRLEEAAQYAHLCREIDPDDIQGEWLFGQVMRLQQSNAQIPGTARQLCWYGILGPGALNACAQPIAAALENGPDALASALQQDTGVRSRFLQLLATHAEWPGKLLYVLAEFLPAAEMEALLREVLLQSPGDTPGKRYAAALLHSMGAKPPYGVWQNGRMAWMDPTRPPYEAPTFRSRILTLRLHQAGKLCPDDHGVIPWAMQIAHRLSPAQRRELTADPARVWPLAFAVAYRAQKGLAPVHVDIHRYSSLRLAMLRQALRIIHRHI